MDISSASHNVVSTAALAERLATRTQTYVLTLKTEDFARTSWLHGREQAAELEIRAAQRFAEIGRGTLRRDDVLAHSFGSDVFAVALAGARDGDDGERELRRSLAGIERTFLERMPIACVSSWATVNRGDDVVRMLESAAERARRRRDRREYAELVHDLATPVSAIAGSLAVVLDGGLDRELQQRFLRGAFEEANRIGRMLHEFLGTGGDSGIPGDATDLGDALTRAFDAVQPLAYERNITLRVCSSIDGPVFTSMHPDVAVSLVVNLAANAVKHGNPGGRVQGRIRANGEACFLEVDDDGPGVDDEDRERIFEFGRRGTAPLAHGWGIGLAQVRRIARDHGGEVCVQRSPLGGARFTVRLPRDSQA